MLAWHYSSDLFTPFYWGPLSGVHRGTSVDSFRWRWSPHDDLWWGSQPSLEGGLNLVRCWSRAICVERRVTCPLPGVPPEAVDKGRLKR